MVSNKHRGHGSMELRHISFQKDFIIVIVNKPYSLKRFVEVLKRFKMFESNSVHNPMGQGIKICKDSEGTLVATKQCTSS